jgi:dethiobiotin synthetase
VILVSGTGTGVGKTHLACALTVASSRRRPTAAYKPVETGVPRGQVGEDSARLDASATFHVKHLPRWTFVQPLTPARAARLEGVELPLQRIVEAVRVAAQDTPGLVVELPGGLFSPLTDRETAADLLAALRPRWVLVAHNRLGALHDVLACVHDRPATPAPAAILLVRGVDGAAGSNAEELRRWTSVPVHEVPEGSVGVLADVEALRELAELAVNP